MTLDIVGGTYREWCKEGEWRQLYGSGLRAAAALQRVDSTRFHTYVESGVQSLLESVAATFEIELNVTASDKTVLFSYDHGLSVPQIFPPLHTVVQQPPLCVNADRVLRFGMVEGDAIVNAKWAVFDPQSAYSPALFHSNGSNAEHLAVVCNRLEATLLTNEKDVAAAANKLRDLDDAEIVVVKCGSHGALVASDLGHRLIPAFQTDRVWPIGSGDVFAAAFFAHWAQLGELAKDAAVAASRAAAHYCDTRVLPLPASEEMPDYEPLALRTISDGEALPGVYLAGPFFNMGERWIVYEAKEALANQGLRVFSPFHDVGFGIASEVVPADIKAITEADIIFALLDHLDSGTLFEIGYARCLGKPVVGFCQSTPDESLKMLLGTDCKVFDDFVSAIYHTSWIAHGL